MNSPQAPTSARAGGLAPLRLGTHQVWPPVVLAPMAGVTNAPFRTMCRRFAPGLVYVNEMVMATALVHGNAKTARMATFGADESFRSLQIYGSDPAIIGEAVRRLADEDRVDHIDLNFGCPAPKVTRRGGGAAVPVKPNLLRAILASVLGAASPHGIPVTAKFRKGIDDDLLTFIRTGQIAEDEGVGRDRVARAHRAAALRGRGRLGCHRRAQGRRQHHPRARQRRHLGGR